eukprot:m.1046589 g.1046589  ORF g.1046589 m.1046589 type:complete len:67 (-) comp24170_c0_seq130:3145-3345(-)
MYTHALGGVHIAYNYLDGQCIHGLGDKPRNAVRIQNSVVRQAMSNRNANSTPVQGGYDPPSLARGG